MNDELIIDMFALLSLKPFDDTNVHMTYLYKFHTWNRRII